MWKSIWNGLSTITIIALTAVVVKWYVKGHYGKYFIFFWLYTIFAIVMYVNYQNTKPKHDPTPGYIYWESNMRNQ